MMRRMPAEGPIDYAALGEYLDAGDEFRPESSSGAERVVRRLIPLGLPLQFRKGLTWTRRGRSRRQLEEALREGRRRFHLGSGRAHKEDWVNIDVALLPIDVAWNLNEPLPVPPGSVEAVFHEHLMEHLTLREGWKLTQECFRMLEPGGVLRIAVPDAGALLRSYAGQSDPDWANSRPTPMLAVMSLFYEHGHLAMYDGELLSAVLTAAGFDQAEARRFGESRIEPCPDSPGRQSGTLYVEGVKPA